MTDMPELMRLKEAASQLGLKVSALRTEIRRGRLLPIEIAGRFYLTKESVGDMIDRCRAKPKAHDSTPDASEAVEDGGLSVTERSSVAQDAAKISLQKLKETSRATLRKSISRAGRSIS